MKRKINWVNIIKFIIFIFCSIIMIHDIYYICIVNWLTGYMYTFTWYGFITFMIINYIAITLGYDLIEQIKSIPSYQPKHARDTK